MAVKESRKVAMLIIYPYSKHLTAVNRDASFKTSM